MEYRTIEEFKRYRIGVTSSQGWFSRIIQFFIGKYTHVFIFYRENIIFHADQYSNRVKFEDFERFIIDSEKLKIHILESKLPIDEKEMDERVQEILYKRYDHTNAIGRAIYRVLKFFGIRRNKRSIFDTPYQYICSEVIGKIFGFPVRHSVNETQTEPEDCLAPDSNFRYCYTMEWNRTGTAFKQYIDETLKND